MRIPKWMLSLLLLQVAVAGAEIRLPNLLSNEAVFQRIAPIHIWGWATADETVTIRFHQQTMTTKANQFGEWETWLKPELAGGPYVLTASGSKSANSVNRAGILVGDVWVASGQSNMEFPLSGFPNQPLKNQEAELAGANHPKIRLLLQKQVTSPVPLDDVTAVWQQCTPETARSFSAIAYFFAREISQQQNVAIGLIDATWGGTPAHSWMSLDALGANDLTSVFHEAGVIAQREGRADSIRRNYQPADGSSAVLPRLPGDHHGSWIPGTLFNGMIAPDTKYTIKGVLWYQGETDTEPQRSPSYDRVFPALISDWRRQWRQGDFPFLFVQISSFSSPADWPQVRYAQQKALSLKNTAMAVTLDVGSAKVVHPPDKQTVAHRLALAALSTVYGEKIAGLSPEFVQATSEAHGMRVWLEHGEGLTTHGQPVGGFELAGEDHVFKPATATLERVAGIDTVFVVSPSIDSPRFVRYDWSDVVTTFLYNSAGLPLGTFSSE